MVNGRRARSRLSKIPKSRPRSISCHGQDQLKAKRTNYMKIIGEEGEEYKMIMKMKYLNKNQYK